MGLKTVTLSARRQKLDRPFDASDGSGSPATGSSRTGTLACPRVLWRYRAGQTRVSVLPSDLTTTQTTGPSVRNTFLLGRRHVVSLRNFGSKCDSLAHRTLLDCRTMRLAFRVARGRQRLRSAHWQSRSISARRRGHRRPSEPEPARDRF